MTGFLVLEIGAQRGGWTGVLCGAAAVVLLATMIVLMVRDALRYRGRVRDLRAAERQERGEC